ncbi:MAG: hypothetical protein HRU40_13965 [Saprospiraceae bacterium]|nr:hypothetical protein [Saprospiraceae bacterium]
MSIIDYAWKYLFAPKGIYDYKYTIPPEGPGMMVSSFLQPINMLRITEMVQVNS